MLQAYIQKSKMTFGGAEALFAASFLFAITGPLVRELGHMWSDEAQVAARFCIVFFMLFVYARIRRDNHKIPRDKLPLALAAAVNGSVAILFYTISMQNIAIANTLFISYAVTMILSFLLGTFLLKEEVSKLKIVAIGCALVGISIYANSILTGGVGFIFALLAGGCGGMTSLLGKKLRGVNRSAVIRLNFGLGAPLMLGIALLSGNALVREVSVYGIIMTIVFALVLIAATHLLLYGIQHFDINVGTVILSMELVFALILGWIFYKELPSTHELIGGAFILIASIIGRIETRRPRAVVAE